jgi:hypothetical protein
VKDHFAELAERIATDVPEALGCVIASFEGEPLAAHPDHVLDLLKPLSVKLSRLSGVRCAFLEFGGSSLFSLRRTAYAIVVVTAQSVDREAVLANLEAAVDRAEGAEPVPAELPSPPGLPELVPASVSATPAADDPASEETGYEHENTVGLAQEFSSLLEETFGGDADADTDADSEAEAEAEAVS